MQQTAAFTLAQANNESVAVLDFIKLYKNILYTILNKYKFKNAFFSSIKYKHSNVYKYINKKR